MVIIITIESVLARLLCVGSYFIALFEANDFSEMRYVDGG